MSATLQPFGLFPIRHVSGTRPMQEALTDGVVSGATADILSYQPVKLSTNGVLQPAAAGDDFLGVFLGCEYTTNDQQRIQSPAFISGTTYVAGSMVAYYTRDQGIIYQIQADGSVAQTAIGGQANISNATSGSTTLGYSQCTINSTITGAGSTAQLRILDLYPGVNNAWGDAYTIVEVQIATQQYTANKAAI